MVTPAGIDLTVLTLPVEEIFFRFTAFREWEASELSLARYCALTAAGDSGLTAIPAFPSRVFRHSALYVRDGAGVDRPEQLRGRRIGIPEWAQTATVWVRGILADDHGVDPADVHWVQAGVEQPGRREGVPLELPPGVQVEAVGDRSLDEMLVAGDLDAVISARPPRSFRLGDARVRRLFADPTAAEEDWHARTGAFPIMHVVALREDVHRAHPWVAANLLSALDEARRRSVERLLDVTASRIPLPWGAAVAARAQALLGGDPFPYGLEPSRATLELFLRYAHEQGVTLRRLSPEDLFAPQTLRGHRV